jgi:hypothetical protein
MNEEVFNLSIRKFLKMVGVNSQRDIEHAFRTRSRDQLPHHQIAEQFSAGIG